ncbi:uncharacterized protein LOC127645934 [Xyrauchen texanus]|uniref:uncharacterized protein LOC127645934 n=1 Tax=Xyrauchen texanus TaxID=154827 RepID=UPI002241DF99|nr:uncharacterized protein LOC127645934 [Xyrauchen texanus]
MWLLGYQFLLLCLTSIHADTNYLQENVAIKGKAEQSSTFYFHANIAIDNGGTSCTHTNTETNPWWRLDLLNSSTIRRVVITNRVDCCPEQIDGAEILIGNSLDNNGNNNPRCAVISGIPAGKSVSYSCGGMEGRYMNVFIPGDSKSLTLCEVKVFRTDNVSLTGNADQSSIFKYWGPQRAVDGIKFAPGAASFCTHSSGDRNPWWRLDLLGIYFVSTVVITNRADCCPERINGAEIRIGNSLENNGNNNSRCAVIDSIPLGKSYNYSCGGMEGRYVNVVIPGDRKYLTLCEVEVYPILDVKKTFVRMKLQSSFDLAGPMNDRLLYQLQSVLASRGISNVRLSWTHLPQQHVEEKDAGKDEFEAVILAS